MRELYMSHLAYIALGTNLGNRLENLRSAVANLLPRIVISSLSPVYETAPWGFEEQPAFLNQVLAGETNLSPADLLMFLKNIEACQGRTPTFRNGPRLIDLDILFYDDRIIRQPDLIIPHEHLHKRAFVLVPLADIAPDYIHPVLNLSIKELLMSVDRSGIKLFSS
jgi:2-amino-4-hydroxy-6-hydroxymethyldihydropteridine diphosphokinase